MGRGSAWSHQVASPVLSCTGVSPWAGPGSLPPGSLGIDLPCTPPVPVCIKGLGHLARTRETVVVPLPRLSHWEITPHRVGRMRLSTALEWLLGHSKGLV